VIRVSREVHCARMCEYECDGECLRRRRAAATTCEHIGSEYTYVMYVFMYVCAYHDGRAVQRKIRVIRV
jgi:hypothetical protein